MRMIQDIKVDLGTLEGINLGNEEQLTHQLFADDMGVFIITLIIAKILVHAQNHS